MRPEQAHAHPRYRNQRRDCAHCAPGTTPLERPRWTSPRCWSAAGPWPPRYCGRPSTGWPRPWTPSPPTTSAGSTPRAAPRTATAARPYAPRSPLLSAEAAGAAPEVGIPGAVAVELVHNFSLLHDDLMDGDEQRRHRDTVWKVHGPAQAILVGDALFALANEILLELGTVEAGRATRRLTTATRKLIDGQAQDISYEHRERVTVEECLEMEGNKTGALLACAVSIGAVLGGADDRTADTLEEYGYHLGLAFQAVDDLLGIWGDPEATGKQTWSDLRQRKKSLPVVAALAAGGPAAERLGELLAGGREEEPADFEDFAEEEFADARRADRGGGRPRVDRPGGPPPARHRHRRPWTRSTCPDQVRDQLTALADFVVVRKR